MISTATTAQIVITRSSNKQDQNNVLKQPAIICTNLRNSVKPDTNRKTRINRTSRHNLTTRTMPNTDVGTPNISKAYSTKPAKMIDASMLFMVVVKNLLPSRQRRKMSSKVNIAKQTCIARVTQGGGGPASCLPGNSARASASRIINAKFSTTTDVTSPSNVLLRRMPWATSKRRARPTARGFSESSVTKYWPVPRLLRGESAPSKGDAGGDPICRGDDVPCDLENLTQSIAVR
mmetsp:Transcript_87938/g.253909  ORF Transcript_87938/g.253909 Transcript_87938/m.253909 type:complete len:234 (-) Transcript_87938:256-957(-)